MTIWKWPLPLSGPITLPLPRGAQVLGTHLQGDQLVLWAMVEPTAPINERDFVVVSTGDPIERSGRFIGTVLVDGGGYVRHVFEIER